MEKVGKAIVGGVATYRSPAGELVNNLVPSPLSAKPR